MNANTPDGSTCKCVLFGAVHGSTNTRIVRCRAGGVLAKMLDIRL